MSYWQVMCENGFPIYEDIYGNRMNPKCNVLDCENYKGME